MVEIRAFIGIDFEPKLKQQIYKLQQEIRKHAIKGRWKHVDNFHLTLKFLDEISLEQKIQVDNALSRICKFRTPVNLEVKGLGTFGEKDFIRVLWLGLTGQVEELLLLQREIDKSLSLIGFSPDKRIYRPHITIGQDIIFSSSIAEVREIEKGFQFDRVKVSRLHLYKSEQVNNRRIYDKVSAYPFCS